MTGQGGMPPARRFGRVLVRVILIVAALCVVAFLFFANSLEKREPANPPVADGIVVLTGGADRILEALQLLEAGRGRRLIISGVNVNSSLDIMKKRWPGRDRLFDCCIDLDYQARNTFENAQEGARWARDNGFRSVLLVTASYHMPRALLEFEAAMPELTILAMPVVPEASRIHRWWQDPVLARIMLMEFAKYAAAILRTTLGLPGR